MKKRMLSMFLALAMLVTLIPAMTAGAEGNGDSDPLVTEYDLEWTGDAAVVNTPEFDLMPYLPEDISITGVSVTLANVLSGYTPTYSSDTAKVKLTTKVFEEPYSETVKSVVSSSNYPDITFNVHITLTGKYAVTISAQPLDSVCDGTAKIGYANLSGILTNGEAYSGAYICTYETADGTPLSGAPTEPGDYKVTIAVPEENETYRGSLTLAFSITEEAEASWQTEENGEWNDGTLGEALADVYDGGTVKLLKDITTDTVIAVSKNITLTSADAEVPCVIGTETNEHGYLLNITGNVTLENIIVDGGRDRSLTAKRALIAVNGGTLTLGSGVVVRNNQNTTNGGIGGGVCLITGELVLDGGTVSGNDAYFGGGVGLAGGIFTAKSGSITNNNAKMGGGVCVWENGSNVGAMNVTGAVFVTNNTADYYGGGINCHYHGSVTLSGAPVIAGNTSGEETDGGIYLDGNKTDGHAAVYISGLADGAEVKFYTWLKTEGLRIAEPAENHEITTADLAKMAWNGADFVLEKDGNGTVILSLPKQEPDVTLATVNGAQMRISGKQGLRFISSIAKSGDFASVKEYGTVLIPTEDVENIEDLVIGATLNGHAACKVPAVYKYAEDDDKITFTAVITDIAEQNYARSYTARAYAIMEDDTVVYGDTYTSRSIYQIAKLILEDASASDAEVDAAQAIVDAVEQYGDNDSSWPWN